MLRRHEIPPANVVFFLGSAIPVENGDIEVGEFWVGTSLSRKFGGGAFLHSSFYDGLSERFWRPFGDLTGEQGKNLVGKKII